MSYFLQLLTLLLGLSLAQPRLQAEVFSLDLGQVGLRPGTLEIAQDISFRDILVTANVGDNKEYLINLPSTAVYHVRVRQQEKVLWREEVFALLNNDAEGRMLRLGWSLVPGAARYRLWLVRSQERARWLETSEHAVLLHRIGVPLLIRLRALTAQGEPLPALGLNFQWIAVSLYEESARAEQASESSFDLNGPDDDQMVYEPTDRELLDGADGPLGNFFNSVSPMNLPPLQRRHEVFVWLRYLREKFSIDKKDRFQAEPSSGLGMGGGGQYFLAPNLVVAGTIDTHATQTNYEAGGAEAPNTQQKRIRLHAAIGLDLLNTHMRTTDWSLFLGPAAGLVQMPLQENEQTFTDYGIRLAGQHYPSRSSLSFLLLKSGSREIDTRWTMPWTIWSISPFLGAYLYNTRQSAGAVTGLFYESGLRFGLERDF